MTKMKKWVAVLISLIVVSACLVCFVQCGDDRQPQETKTTTTVETACQHIYETLMRSGTEADCATTIEKCKLCGVEEVIDKPAHNYTSSDPVLKYKDGKAVGYTMSYTCSECDYYYTSLLSDEQIAEYKLTPIDELACEHEWADEVGEATAEEYLHYLADNDIIDNKNVEVGYIATYTKVTKSCTKCDAIEVVITREDVKDPDYVAPDVTIPPETSEAPVTTEPATTSKVPATTTKAPETTKKPETTAPPVTTNPHTHSYSVWKTTKDATCTSKGTKTRTCSCGDTQTESIAATGHSYGSWKTTTAATCVTAGSQSRICSKCGVSETKAVNATGHSYGAWTQTKAPTCTTNGVKAQTCSSCKHVKEEAVAATGHAWDNGKTTVTPTTCSDMGIKTYTCTVCKTTRIEQVKGNHSFGDWQWEETTCMIKWTNGIITRDVEVDTHKKFHTCSKCKYKEYAPFTPHECYREFLNNDGNTTFTTIREATCAVPGIVRATCKVCGWYYEYERFSVDHTWEGRKFKHLSDYTEYTDELDVYTNICTTCGLKTCTYVRGKSSATPGYESIYTVASGGGGTAYAGYPVNDDFSLVDHPEWQAVVRNVVYDSNGYSTQWDIIWWDTALNKRCTDTVIVANVPKMFEDAGFDLSQYNLNKITFHLKCYYGKLVPERISWSG